MGRANLETAQEIVITYGHSNIDFCGEPKSHLGFELLNPGSQKQCYAWSQVITPFHSSIHSLIPLTLIPHRFIKPHTLCVRHQARNRIGVQKAPLCLGRQSLNTQSNWALDRHLYSGKCSDKLCDGSPSPFLWKGGHPAAGHWSCSSLQGF